MMVVVEYTGRTPAGPSIIRHGPVTSRPYRFDVLAWQPLAGSRRIVVHSVSVPAAARRTGGPDHGAVRQGRT